MNPEPVPFKKSSGEAGGSDGESGCQPTPNPTDFFAVQPT